MNALVWHSPPISSCVYVPVCSYALPLDFVFFSSQIPDYFPPSSFIPSLLVFFFFLLKMSLLGMNTDWFVLKLINCWRKTCGWSMRQPQRGPRKALASEGAPPKGEKGRAQVFLLAHQQGCLRPAQVQPLGSEICDRGLNTQPILVEWHFYWC